MFFALSLHQRDTIMRFKVFATIWDPEIYPTSIDPVVVFPSATFVQHDLRPKHPQKVTLVPAHCRPLYAISAADFVHERYKSC